MRPDEKIFDGKTQRAHPASTGQFRGLITSSCFVLLLSLRASNTHTYTHTHTRFAEDNVCFRDFGGP